MFEYVLVIYFDSAMQKAEYVGNFESCAHANQYLLEHDSEFKERTWDKCLHQDYLFLPKNFIMKFPKLHGMK